MAKAVIYSRAIVLPTLADGLRVFIKLAAMKLLSLPLPLAIHLAGMFLPCVVICS